METSNKKRQRSEQHQIQNKENEKLRRQTQKEELEQLRGIESQYRSLRTQYDSLRNEYDSMINFRNQKEQMEKEFGSLRQQHMTLEKKLEQVQIDREEYKCLNMAIYKEMANLQTRNQLLEEKLQQMEEENLELKTRLKDLMNTIQLEIEEADVKQQIVENTLNLISQLPHNSPHRRPLLRFFFEGLSQNDCSEDLWNFI
jgi:chromosome segregation ATPase